MAGFDVSRGLIDVKAAESVLALRRAFEQVGRLSAFLTDNPKDPVTESDPLVDKYGYTIDEAYMIRLVFEQLEAAHAAVQPTFSIARRLVGLE